MFLTVLLILPYSPGDGRSKSLKVENDMSGQFFYLVEKGVLNNTMIKIRLGQEFS